MKIFQWFTDVIVTFGQILQDTRYLEAARMDPVELRRRLDIVAGRD